MAACEKNLRGFLKVLEPTARQKTGAVRSHKHLRAELNNGNFRDRIVTSYLSGSYSRGTAIAPLDDVDIIFIVDPSHWSFPLFSSLPNPEDVIKSFTRAVKYRYPNSRVRSQRRSMCLMLSHIELDVVPAIECNVDGRCILIPDKEDDEWIQSSPKAHSDVASKINEINGGKLKPIIKIVKFWNSRLPDTARLKSFAVETLAIQVFSNVRIRTLQEGLLVFFDFILHSYKGGSTLVWGSNYGISLRWPRRLYDASGSSNLLSRASYQKINRFVVYAERSRSYMLASYSAKLPETAWKKVSVAIRR